MKWMKLTKYHILNWKDVVWIKHELFYSSNRLITPPKHNPNQLLIQFTRTNFHTVSRHWPGRLQPDSNLWQSTLPPSKPKTLSASSDHNLRGGGADSLEETIQIQGTIVVSFRGSGGMEITRHRRTRWPPIFRPHTNTMETCIFCAPPILPEMPERGKYSYLEFHKLNWNNISIKYLMLWIIYCHFSLFSNPFTLRGPGGSYCGKPLLAARRGKFCQRALKAREDFKEIVWSIVGHCTTAPFPDFTVVAEGPFLEFSN